MAMSNDVLCVAPKNCDEALILRKAPGAEDELLQETEAEERTVEQLISERSNTTERAQQLSSVAEFARINPLRSVMFLQSTNAENLLSCVGFGCSSPNLPTLYNTTASACLSNATAALGLNVLPINLNACELLGLTGHPFNYEQSKVLARFRWDSYARWAKHAKRTGMRLPL